MTAEQIKKLISEREKITLEFKEATTGLPGSFFDTVCAFLNREGGIIILGVDDDGQVLGVDPAAVTMIHTNIVNLSNNPQKLDPPFILYPVSLQVDGKVLLYVQVPASSQVHKCNGVVYDRSNDGDFRITDTARIAQLYNQKKLHYSESVIYRGLRMEDFKPELFSKIRNLIRSRTPSHPWLALNDEQLLRKANLWRRDLQTGEEGYTLAAALLLGQDEVIASLVPHFKIDALVRRQNLERYDDRLDLRTNLVECYEQLMAFLAKHLPDKFHLEGDQRISLREKIFREVVANLVVHREYTNALPTQVVIYSDWVEVTNANNPHGRGPLIPDRFSPYPKNPSLAKFFIQLGWVDELGSGVLNVHRYLKEYVAEGAIPQFIEGEVFRTIIPLSVFSLGPLARPVLDFLQVDTRQWTDEDHQAANRLGLAQHLKSYTDQVDQLYYQLGLSWAEKGTKLLSVLKLEMSKIPRFEDWQGLSTAEKGTKLLPKQFRLMVSLLFYCLTPKPLGTLADWLGFAHRSKFKNAYLSPLLEAGLLVYTIPEKVNSPNQMYVTTALGKTFLGGIA